MFYQAILFRVCFSGALPTRSDFFVEDFSLIVVVALASLLIGILLTLCLTIVSLMIHHFLRSFNVLFLRQARQFRLWVELQRQFWRASRSVEVIYGNEISRPH